MTQWEHLTALELGRAIARGEVTIPEVTQGALERIARERYMMKKPDEDIFIFEE